MALDIRHDVARYYDLFPPPFDDVAFYQHRIPSPDANVLELGCGTGRVLVPLAGACAFIHGVDGSQAMLDICGQKLKEAKVTNATLSCVDITALDLGQTFDLITAPFRVMQNLATDEHVNGLLTSIRRHLNPGGTAILNAFNPMWARDELIARWGDAEERGREVASTPEGQVVSTEIWQNLDTDPLVLHPDLIYRLESDGHVVDEARFRIDMRVWYPHEFEALITDHGFRIVNQWGGYEGQKYGEPGELLVEFALE